MTFNNSASRPTDITVGCALGAADPLPDTKVNKARVARVALGEILAAPGVAALSPLAAGCLVVLVHHAIGRGWADSRSFAVNAREAQAVLAMKGLACGDAELVLTALGLAGSISVAGSSITIPVLDQALQQECAALANRMAGWGKRKSGASGYPVLAAPAPAARPKSTAAPAPAPAPALALSPAAAAAVDPLRDAECGSPSSGGKSAPQARRVEGGVKFHRFTSSDKVVTDPLTDPVVLRIPCKGNAAEAEITADYVRSLADAYRRVDVEEELRKCRVWSLSNPAKRKTFTGFRRFLNRWMAEADRTKSVVKAVVGAASQRNGFGQGGSYQSQVDAAASAGTSAAAPAQGSLLEANGAAAGPALDDFRDLLASVRDTSPASSPVQQDVAHAMAAAEPGATHGPVAGSSRASVLARRRYGRVQTQSGGQA